MFPQSVYLAQYNFAVLNASKYRIIILSHHNLLPISVGSHAVRTVVSGLPVHTPFSTAAGM